MEEIPIIEIPTEIQEKLRQPLPAEAIGEHPRIQGLSSINAAFVIERLNDAFGNGGWRDTVREIAMTSRKETWNKGKDNQREVTLHTATVHLTFFVEKYGIHKENFGGSDNEDLGDALKGARTDALTKIASELGVGLDVYKSKRSGAVSAPACPSCGKTLRKSKDGDGWYCWTKRDGCGANFTNEGLAMATASKNGATKKDAASAPSPAPAPVAEKITIHGKITNPRQDGDTFFVNVGSRLCATKQPDISRRFFGKKDGDAELLVAPIQTSKGLVHQILKVITVLSEREAAGHDGI